MGAYSQRGVHGSILVPSTAGALTNPDDNTGTKISLARWLARLEQGMRRSFGARHLPRRDTKRRLTTSRKDSPRLPGQGCLREDHFRCLRSPHPPTTLRTTRSTTWRTMSSAASSPSVGLGHSALKPPNSETEKEPGFGRGQAQAWLLRSSQGLDANCGVPSVTHSRTRWKTYSDNMQIARGLKGGGGAAS